MSDRNSNDPRRGVPYGGNLMQAEESLADAVQEQLRLAEHLQLLLESTDQGIYGIDRQGRCTFVNPSAAHMLGYHPDELLGERMHQLVHHTRSDGSPYPVEECPIYQAFEESRGTRVDSEVLWRRDETPIPVEYSSYPIVRDGVVEGAIVTFVDITERRRTEEKLKEGEERFRLLAENAKDIIYRYRFKPTPGFEYVSPSATAITGYTPEEHYADPELGLKLVHPDDRHILEAFLRSPESAAKVLTLRWINRDGQVIWTEQQISLFYDDEDELAAIEGIGRNITERKEVEDALRRSEKRFRSVVQNASDIIMILEADGTIRYVSPAIEGVLGIQTEDVVGKNAVAFVDPVDRTEAIRIFVEARKEPGITPPVEFRLRREDGAWRHLEINRSNLLGDPAVEGIVFNLRDVTDRKVAEEQLRRRAFHDLLGGLQSRYLLLDTNQERDHRQGKLNEGVPQCEFAEILPGESCGLPGKVWSEEKLLCEMHARQSELRDRVDLLRGVITSLELCLDNVAVRRDANFVRLLKAEVAHATAELELAQGELQRAKRQE
ncbi:MAG TPA: PAS domain S-box protein [Rubrobacteraceae bacterium]|nr:PAS domain S-box protein [Rubrobacteraceae bacterium]